MEDTKTKMANTNDRELHTLLFKDLDGEKISTEKMRIVLEMYAQEINNLIKYGVLQEQLKDLLVNESHLNNYAKRLKIFEEEHLKKIYMVGILKSVIEIAKKQEETKNKDTDKKILLDGVGNNKHLANMISVIYHSNSITHSNLAIKLNISKSCLSNLNQKLEELELYSTEKRGRNKYYYSNLNTKKLYKSIVSVQSDSHIANYGEIEDMFNKLLIVLIEETKNSSRLDYKKVLERLPFIKNNERNDTISNLKIFAKTINESNIRKENLYEGIGEWITLKDNRKRMYNYRILNNSWG